MLFRIDTLSESLVDEDTSRLMFRRPPSFVKRERSSGRTLKYLIEELTTAIAR